MSSAATGLPPNVESYVQALRAELADLAAEERDDLLSEVEPSLLEAAGDGDDPIAARLGPAADFAADLRASAGLPPAPRSAAPRTGLTASLARVAASEPVRRARSVLRELAPVWWAARSYVALGALALALGVEWSVKHPFLPRFGSIAGTALLLALVLAGSLALGLWTRRAGRAQRAAVMIFNAVLVVAAVPVLDRATDTPGIVPAAFFDQVAAQPHGVALDGRAVENIYPYDRRGRLLHDVRLFDDLGKRLTVANGDDPDQRRVFERGGARVRNAFPIRYFEPGTRRVARPNAGPDVHARPLRTPPLPRR